ncbi:hypothetical protein [Anoxybacillus sp.]|uniref:hypothetical protein n=1 Tax=Anoxybacillus sp. TaxID=1872573 RepID=UPI00260416C7|nr:hypothetical protein [uncultured Anoxybacillus sp.]
MVGFYLILAITVASLYVAFRKQKPFFLLIPFLSVFAYFLFEVITFPAPFLETVKFIFNLGVCLFETN